MFPFRLFFIQLKFTFFMLFCQMEKIGEILAFVRRKLYNSGDFRVKAPYDELREVRMTDFHTHILPNIDDGASSPEVSRRLLDSLIQQGVSEVALTPHFYANRQSLSSFLEKRERSFSALQAVCGENDPDFRLGAEVYYWSGMAKMEGLSQLCLGESRLLLLEMPFQKWTEYSIGELLDLSSHFDLLLAHVDRYFSFQKDRTWEALLDRGIRFQVNADAFLQFGTKRKALHMLEAGELLCLGSDCHDPDSRPPRIDEAMTFLKKRIGPHAEKEIFSLSFKDIS